MIIINELAYSFHLSSDKNKKNSVRKSAKNNVSKTTSMSNNAIQNAKQLSKVDHHNYRMYDNKQDEIVIVRGTSSLYKDVENFYKTVFEDARKEYNERQARDDRKIDNYFKKISNNSKSDLACEIIIELGNKQFWDTKDIDYKYKMTNVYKKQIQDLELIVPNFKVCSAIIHYDETSPHMHIVGVPIKYNCKTGMKMQVVKTSVFTRNSLKQIQDKMRILCIEEYNKEYNLNATLKRKLKGRNIDIHVTNMNNYQEIKKQIENNQKKIDFINTKATELNNESDNLKQRIKNIRKAPVIKDSYIISGEDKLIIESYIDKVSETNKEYKDITTLSASLKNLNQTIKVDKNNINILRQNNESLELKVESLNQIAESQKKRIDKLKKDNFSLKNELQQLKLLFKKIVNIFRRMINRKDKKDIYTEILEDMYNSRILDDKTIDNILNYNVDLEKKDDYEL